MRARHKEKVVLLSSFSSVDIWDAIIFGRRRKYALVMFLPGIPEGVRKIIARIPFLHRYIKDSIEVRMDCLGNYRGLWFEINTEVIRLTQEFFRKKALKDHPVIRSYNKYFRNDKIEGFLKKIICKRIFELLRQLHLMRFSDLSNLRILYQRHPIDNYVIQYFSHKYGLRFKTEMFSSPGFIIFLPGYYLKTLVDIVRRGITFNHPRKKYLLSRESVWGFFRKLLRDDFMIGGEDFQTKDIIFYACDLSSPDRQEAYAEAGRRGFATSLIAHLPLNINKNIGRIFYFYLLWPLVLFIRLMRRGDNYWIGDFLKFQRNCFFIEMFANFYDIGANISNSDHDDIAATLILNQYGTKNIILHWSDLTPYQFATHAFVGHNIYFFWGKIHDDIQAKEAYIDERINIGCIYKKSLKDSIEHKDEILSFLPQIDRLKKSVLFCDTSFSNLIEYTEKFFLDYYEVIIKFCETHPNINVILKPKNPNSWVLNSLTSERKRYQDIFQELEKMKNFIYLDSLSNIEDAIAIADVCVSMAMNTPSTISLICEREALYYDTTGNREHPFARKYMDQIVFDNPKNLFVQIDNILNGSFRCRDVISDREIREFDAFKDSNAFDRIKYHLRSILNKKVGKMDIAAEQVALLNIGNSGKLNNIGGMHESFSNRG